MEDAPQAQAAGLVQPITAGALSLSPLHRPRLSLGPSEPRFGDVGYARKPVSPGQSLADVPSPLSNAAFLFFCL